MQRKIAYIVPGYHESPYGKGYRDITKAFTKIGIRPIPVTIHWKRHTMTDYINEFEAKFKKASRPGDRNYFLGFSFGAYISFVASSWLPANTLILCSMSPYFKEDLEYHPKSWANWAGKKKMEDFKKYRFSKLSKRFGTKTILLVGAKEHPLCIRRARLAHRALKGSRLVIIPETKHDVRAARYQAEIKRQIELLDR